MRLNMAPNYLEIGFGGLSCLGRPQNGMFFFMCSEAVFGGGGSGHMSSVFFLRTFGYVLLCVCYVSVMCLLCIRYVLLCVCYAYGMFCGLFQELRSH